MRAETERGGSDRSGLVQGVSGAAWPRNRGGIWDLGGQKACREIWGSGAIGRRQYVRTRRFAGHEKLENESGCLEAEVVAIDEEEQKQKGKRKG